MTAGPEIQKRVLEAHPRDRAKGIIRLDYASMNSINASQDDTIEIKGKKRTVAKCLPLASDEREGIVRIDGLIRRNAGVSIGDSVFLRKISAVEAQTIFLKPVKVPKDFLKHGLNVPSGSEKIASALNGVPITKEDYLEVPYFLKKLVFQVIGFSPDAAAATIVSSTQFISPDSGESATVSLRVEEALARDAGLGLARVDQEAIDALGVSGSEVIGIKGQRQTVAKCLLLVDSSNQHKGIIRIDGLIRKNAGVVIGELVTVRKATTLPAEKVTVAALSADPPIPATTPFNEQCLVNTLEGRPVTKDDHILIPYHGSMLSFQITENTPASDVVLITKGTNFAIVDRVGVLMGLPQGASPYVTYEDIGGLEEEIQKLRDTIELSLDHRERFQKLGVKAPRGILLYGPPGTGKTLLAKALATERMSSENREGTPPWIYGAVRAHFIPVLWPSLLSKFVGESEARVREIFKEAVEKAPTIIFLDNIESIGKIGYESTVESRMQQQLIDSMAELTDTDKVVVIAATSKLEELEPALMVSGRFDVRIEIKVPAIKGRFEILRILTKGMPLHQGVNLEKLASMTEGLVGADLQLLCREAAQYAWRRRDVISESLGQVVVTEEDFEKAVKSFQNTGQKNNTAT